MKWVKTIALVLGGLVVLAAVAVGVLIATFDANRYKGVAVDWMAQNHQRTLTIDGPVQLSVLPRLAVKLQDVRLSERQRPDEFARVGEASLAVELWPLLRKELVVDRVVLADAHVRYRRDAKGRSNVDDFLGGGEPGAQAPPPGDGGTSRPPRFDVQGVELKNVRASVDDAQADLHGDVVLRALSTGRLADGVQTPVAFDVGLALKQPAAEGDLQGKAQLRFDAGSDALELRDVEISYAGALGARRLEASLDWPQLDVGPKSVGGSAWQARVALSGDTPLRVELQAQPPAGSLDDLRLPGLKVRVNAGELAADVQGELALQARNAVRWQLQGTLNGERFTTDGTASTAGKVPSVKAQANFAALDLGRLQPARAQAPAAPSKGDAPVDLSALRAVQADVSVQAGRLVYPPYRVEEARLVAKVDGGVLRVTTLAGKLWGGRFDGSASADARNQRLALKGVAQDIDVRAALQDVAQKDIVEGKGRVTVDVSSAGKTVAELKSRLSGQAALLMRDGAIKGVNLARVLRQAKAALELRKDALLQASQAEKTDFTELSASFGIADGVARNKDLSAKSPFLRLTGEGAIDIARNRIDYTVRALLAGTAEGQGGEAPEALRGVTVPVRLTGPLEAIEWKVLWSEVARGALQRRLEDAVRERLGGERKPQEGESGDLKDQLLRRLLR